MKIQFFGDNTFGVFDKKSKVIFEATDNITEKDLDFTTNSNGKPSKIEAKKNLSLPGEYEISNILVKSMSQKADKNIIFKIVMNELAIVHCGNMVETPDKKLFEELGEDIDVLFLNISTKFPAKKVKDLIETIEPRITFIGGEKNHFPEIKSMMEIVMHPENSLDISKSSLSDDKSEHYILSV